MKHIGTKEINTERLTLRRFVETDAQAMFDNWASDDEATKHLTWPTHQDVVVTQVSVNSWVASYEALNTYKWAITLKEKPSEVIGDISVVAINEQTKECVIGYVLGRNYWSNGYMSEAMVAVCRYLLNEGPFNRIEALHDMNNPASGKVMMKAGLHYEGTHRQHSLNNNGLVDTARYAILKEDYLLD